MMNGPDRQMTWTSLKQRLGLKRMGCCGAMWGHPSASNRTEPEEVGPPNRRCEPGMNLAMALAAERNSRGSEVGPTQQVKSLMTLIEETDGRDWSVGRRRETDRCDSDWLCCVCMETPKGAAFIPCGHAFCRVCSREMWVNRAMCPVCNRPILEILDIY